MTIADLEARMDAAAAALDFEEARRLRDLIAVARQTGADPDAIGTDVGAADLIRQQPGAMGIGSSQPKPVTRPAGSSPGSPTR